MIDFLPIFQHWIFSYHITSHFDLVSWIHKKTIKNIFCLAISNPQTVNVSIWKPFLHIANRTFEKKNEILGGLISNNDLLRRYLELFPPIPCQKTIGVVILL